MTPHAHGAALLLLSALLAGCTPALTVDNPFEIDVSEYPRVVDAAAQVLRDNGFVVDRHDYRFGVITSRPLDSPTVFEPWRPLNSTADQALQSTMNSERRVVRITIDPIDPAGPSDTPDPPEQAAPATGAYNLAVHVAVERLQHPTRQLTGSTHGYRVFGAFRDTPGELQARGISGLHWRTVGNDPHLEQRLLQQIVRRSFQMRRAERERIEAEAQSRAEQDADLQTRG